MINRYLGNKTDLLDPIISVVDDRCGAKARVCDIFSGTLAVSLKLKQFGYSVVANDINLFSYVIGRAFLVNSAIPEVGLKTLVPLSQISELRDMAMKWASEISSTPGFVFLMNERFRAPYVDLLSLIIYLQNLQPHEVPSSFLRSDFFDAYTEEGRNSHYMSQRGRSGNRKFFTPSNGRKIDTIVSQIRYWRLSGLIEDTLYYTLLSILIRGIEKISNTQGTYHDFPRDCMDPRALNPLKLDAPAFDVCLAGGEHFLGKEADSLEFIIDAPPHDLLYIDPPYNFRQYTSYYFMHNLICGYADINDLEDYFSRIKYVRGQNMDDDFVSTFCKAKLFVDSLRLLIERAKTRFVVLSYFSGKNHWNGFDSQTNGIGFEKLQNLFLSDLFLSGSLEVIPIARTNYQSYGGFRAKEVLEYLFIAEKQEVDLASGVVQSAKRS